MALGDLSKSAKSIRKMDAEEEELKLAEEKLDKEEKAAVQKKVNKKVEVKEPKTEKVEKSMARVAAQPQISKTVKRPESKVKLVEKDKERDRSPAPQREPRADSSDLQQSATRRAQAHHVPKPRPRSPTRPATPPIL